MISDQLLRLADGQSLAIGIGASQASSNVIDIDTLRNLGVGESLFVRIRFDTAYTQASGGTNVLVVYADNSALTTNVVTLAQIPYSSTTIPAAQTVLYIPIPPVSRTSMTIPNDAKKYLGVLWQAYTAAVTGGTWTVDVVTDVNMVENTYSKGFTVV